MKPESETIATTPLTAHLPTLNEQERQLQKDYEWCLHDDAVRRQYAGKVVVAHRGRIFGAGTNHSEAWQAAQQNADCPAKGHAAVLVVPPA